jgi:2-methylisocitrate lyase-like PEP mutase family enzyme
MKIRVAAAAAQRYDDLVVVGSTDARSAIDLNVAIERVRTYCETDVIMLFVKATQTVNKLNEIVRRTIT